jgi:hypothetical protein
MIWNIIMHFIQLKQCISDVSKEQLNQQNSTIKTDELKPIGIYRNLGTDTRIKVNMVAKEVEKYIYLFTSAVK